MLWQKVCTADIIIPCVPISAFEEVVGHIVPEMNEESAIFDICTVKSYTEKILQKYKGLLYVCTHPMFGPESFLQNNNSVENFRCAVTGYRGDRVMYERLLDMLHAIGIKVIEVSSDEHDKMLAETLFVTHYIGQLVNTA